MKILRSARTTISLPIRLLSVMLVLAATAFAGDAMATTYRVVALPMPEGALNSDAQGINAAGEVVDWVAIPGRSGTSRMG